MNIATALNKKYLSYTIVMLTSLCENNPTHIDAWLLNTELVDQDFQVLRNALQRYDIHCFDAKVSASMFDARCPHTEEWSMESYYRLVLLDLLPESIDRLLYLDVDIIINNDLSDLYDRELGGMDLWAADNFNGIPVTYENMGPKQREVLSPYLADGYRYFNSGVLLLNLRQIRDKYSTDTYFQAMENWNYQMDCPDQDILNYVHRNSVGWLPWKKYNLFASHAAFQLGLRYEEVIKETSIIHYAGAKPWNTTNLHYDTEQIWWDYAEKTPVYLPLLKAFQISVMSNRSIEDRIRGLTEDNQKIVSISRSLAERIKQLGSSV